MSLIGEIVQYGFFGIGAAMLLVWIMFPMINIVEWFKDERPFRAKLKETTKCLAGILVAVILALFLVSGVVFVLGTVGVVISRLIRLCL